MHKLQQLFDRLVGIPPASLSHALFPSAALDRHRLSELATPACWRRSARQGKAPSRFPSPVRVVRQA